MEEKANREAQERNARSGGGVKRRNCGRGGGFARPDGSQISLKNLLRILLKMLLKKILQIVLKTFTFHEK